MNSLNRCLSFSECLLYHEVFDQGAECKATSSDKAFVRPHARPKSVAVIFGVEHDWGLAEETVLSLG